MTYRTLICEHCFEINDCKTVESQLLLENGTIELSLEWTCPACRTYSRLPVEGDLDEAFEAYNKNITAIRDGMREGLRRNSMRSEDEVEKEQKEERLYLERRKKAEELDAQEGTNAHATRVYFGYYFRRQRLKKGIKQTQAAKEIGIRRETLQRIEMGEAGYSQETVIAMGRLIEITPQKACEMAGIEAPPKPPKRTDRTALINDTRADFNETIEIEDDAKFLYYAILLRRQFQKFKEGLMHIRAIELPAQPYAIAAAQQAISALKTLDEAKRISTFYAIARTELSKKQRYQWISELIQVLSSEQIAELTQELIDLTEKKKTDSKST